MKERGGKVPLLPLKYLVPFHCSIFTQIPLLSLRILIPSSVKFALFLLPPPFLMWSRAGTKHIIHNRLWSAVRDHYCSYSFQNRRDVYWRSEERHTAAIRGSHRTSQSSACPASSWSTAPARPKQQVQPFHLLSLPYILYTRF